MSVLHTFDVTVQRLNDDGTVLSEHTVTTYCCFDIVDALRVAATDRTMSMAEYFACRLAGVHACRLPRLSTVSHFDYLP